MYGISIAIRLAVSSIFQFAKLCSPPSNKKKALKVMAASVFLCILPFEWHHFKTVTLATSEVTRFLVF